MQELQGEVGILLIYTGSRTMVMYNHDQQAFWKIRFDLGKKEIERKVLQEGLHTEPLWVEVDQEHPLNLRNRRYHFQCGKERKG